MLSWYTSSSSCQVPTHLKLITMYNIINGNSFPAGTFSLLNVSMIRPSTSSTLYMQTFAKFECLSWHEGPTTEQHISNGGEYKLRIWIEEQMYPSRSRIAYIHASFRLTSFHFNTLVVCAQTKKGFRWQVCPQIPRTPNMFQSFNCSSEMVE